jgi:hypothetical protein
MIPFHILYIDFVNLYGEKKGNHPIFLFFFSDLSYFLEKRKYQFTQTISPSPNTVTTHLAVIKHLLYTFSFCRRSLRELETTDTELKAMAAEAMIGLSRIPKKGYKMPAAIGIPRAL